MIRRTQTFVIVLAALAVVSAPSHPAIFLWPINAVWASYGMMVFPLVAWVFGVGAIPYNAHVFPPVMPRAVTVTVINLAVMATAAWLKWGPSGEHNDHVRIA
jgi:hypothetical protein